MDEQFDKKLSNHIREVFDNYEHPGADKGWAQLRAQLPAQQRRNKVAWLWWSSAAAIAVVFLGLGIWYSNQNNTTNNTVVKNTVKLQQQPATTIQKPAAGSLVMNTPLQPVNDGAAMAQNNKPAFNSSIVIPTYVGAATTKATTDNTNSVATNNNTNAVAGYPQPTFTDAPTSLAVQTNAAATNANTTQVDSQKISADIANQPQMARVKPADAGIVSAPTNSAAKKPAKTIDDMFAADGRARAVAKTNTEDKQVAKKVNFSIYAATYFNYAEGSTNQVNAGAGFTSDIRLSKNLKLSTGMALAQNTLSYNYGAPSGAAAKNMVANAPALRQEALFATTAVLPIFKNYNASLVGLDIPINIKYEFNPQKNDTYVSAGLSSGTFINESYTYNYTYGNGASSSSVGQDQQTTRNSFNSFYFGKTLNLSFGVGYPVGGNRLIVEPFVKYPLGGLGAQDIRFGAGGVNLKFSFKTQKK
ncbi:hypothetical protein [Mucilaginibacter phyllosphaerae]